MYRDCVAALKACEEEPKLQEVTPFYPAVYSLASQASSRSTPEAETGTLSILRLGKLVSRDRETLCRLLRISAGEIVADARSPYLVGEAVSVELNADQRVAGRVVWRSGRTIGIGFDADLDIGAVLAKRESREGSRTRAPRVPAACFARLRIGATYQRVSVHDVSQGGIRIELDGGGWIGEDAVLSLDGLPPIKGVVRWSGDGQAGISFNDRMPFHALTEWLEFHSQSGWSESAESRVHAAQAA